MNQAQVDQVKEIVESFYNLNFEKLMADFYKDEPDFMQELIGDYTVKDYILITNKMFRHFKDELNDPNFKTLPFSYNYSPEFGSGNLTNDISYVITYIVNEDFKNSFGYTLRLVNYQRQNGFWERSSRKYFRTSEAKNIEDREVLDSVRSHLESASSDLKSIINSVEIKINDIDSFLVDKKEEFKIIDSQVQNINKQNTSINELNNDAVAVVEKINSQYTIADIRRNDAEKLLNQATSQLEVIDNNLTEYEKTYEKNNHKFKELDSNFSEKLEFVESKTEFFAKRNEYLEDLIGREVGASLFETFQQRKKELQGSVLLWTIAVPVLAVFTIVWIFVVFYFSRDKELSYQILLINSIKVLPALGLLLFGIAQYGKERTFQEEYAFKSAVALTLNAYAEQLKDDINKDALIMQSVNSIYRTPINSQKIKTSEAKPLMDSARELVDSAKGIMDRK